MVNSGLCRTETPSLRKERLSRIPVETADEKALEIELRRDPKIEIPVECVVMCHERAGCGTARNRMHIGVSTSMKPRPSMNRRIAETILNRSRTYGRTSGSR